MKLHHLQRKGHRVGVGLVLLMTILKETNVEKRRFDGNSLNRRHGRNNYIYYSSGGSNGGRSPPPEIPLLSAVPPPGVKKPMGKRVIPHYLKVDVRGHCGHHCEELPMLNTVYAPPDTKDNLFGVYVGFRDVFYIRPFVNLLYTPVKVRVDNPLLIPAD
ncbi:hypothetical protein ANCDUO_03677 [Ancylostoma duodenale]|uniref:Uncharacterized protein n=1 Tax=Ancylostoma duodenale TaxID=51022 RepID=A0A0C2D8F6_9BILA|nr:hypothetical protein ANCDUO_03677 [Ancylostoma duodenale]